MIQALLQIRFSGGFRPIQEDGIHPGRVARCDGLLEQVEEPGQLLLKIGTHFHAARQFMPDAFDPYRSYPGKRFLDGCCCFLLDVDGCHPEGAFPSTSSGQVPRPKGLEWYDGDTSSLGAGGRAPATTGAFFLLWRLRLF